MDVKEILKEDRVESIKDDHFWGKLISTVSIIEGVFILYNTGYLTVRLDTYLLGINENIFGWLLIVLGVSKLVGILVENKLMMAGSIILLSAVWGMLFTVAILWSFGIGYPNDAFLTNGMILATCLRIAHKGIYNRNGLD